MMRTATILFLSAWLAVPAASTGSAPSGQASRGARAAERGPQSPLAEMSRAIEDTAERVAPAVVEIFATTYAPGDGVVPSVADLVRTERGSGSGVIVDASGYIVTNAHVVRGAQRLRVELPVPGGRSILARHSRTVNATLVGIDLETDLAVIRVDGRALPTVEFGDSDDLRSGQLVLAVGSPLGLQNSISLGVISAVARQLEPESPMIYIQTDASLNTGNSGGPLVDLEGRLVGINTLIASRSGGNDGLGFAAPSNIVRDVYEQIRANGRVRRGEIGIRAQTITPALAAGLRLARAEGVIIADVIPGSPAAQAGLRPGDLVLTLDGKPMENGRQLQVGLYRRFAGDLVTLEVRRGAETLRLPVAMTERDDPFTGVASPADPRQHLVARLGVLAVDLDRRIADALPVIRVSSGVVVAATVDGAIDARDGGFAVGDVIYALNGMPVAGLTELRTAIDRLGPGAAVVLHIERRGELLYLAFTVE